MRGDAGDPNITRGCARSTIINLSPPMAFVTYNIHPSAQGTASSGPSRSIAWERDPRRQVTGGSNYPAQRANEQTRLLDQDRPIKVTVTFKIRARLSLRTSAFDALCPRRARNLLR
jgi:hypothetical protein